MFKRILLTAAAFGALGAAVAYYRYKLLERFEVLDDPTDDEDRVFLAPEDLEMEGKRIHG